jgi:hypothetical protein
MEDAPEGQEGKFTCTLIDELKALLKEGEEDQCM